MISVLFLQLLWASNNLLEVPFFQRVAVFPLSGVPTAAAEDAWWQVRETLTRDQKFIVASRRFMINRGVFQGRRELSNSDAIVMGKILDAQVLVTIFVNERHLTLHAYLGKTGFLLSEISRDLQPALGVSDQIVKASTDLTNEFMAKLPFQGYQIPFDETDRIYMDKGPTRRARVAVGLHHSIKVGEDAEWIRVYGKGIGALLSGEVRIDVLATGKVLSVEEGWAEVEVRNLKDFKTLREEAMVRFPAESKRLIANLPRPLSPTKLEYEYLSQELRPPEELNKEHRFTSTAIGFIGSLITFLLFAF